MQRAVKVFSTSRSRVSPAPPAGSSAPSAPGGGGPGSIPLPRPGSQGLESIAEGPPDAQEGQAGASRTGSMGAADASAPVSQRYQQRGSSVDTAIQVDGSPGPPGDVASDGGGNVNGMSGHLSPRAVMAVLERANMGSDVLQLVRSPLGRSNTPLAMPADATALVRQLEARGSLPGSGPAPAPSRHTAQGPASTLGSGPGPPAAPSPDPH